jgi:hypothetical protein
LRPGFARATTASAGTRYNAHAVGWVHDRLVLLIPAHAVMLVSFAAEHLDDLSSARRLAVHAMRLNPVTCADAGFNGLIRHQFTSFAAIKPLGHQLGIGGRPKPAAVIYRCASLAQKQSFRIRAAIRPVPATTSRTRPSARARFAELSRSDDGAGRARARDDAVWKRGADLGLRA